MMLHYKFPRRLCTHRLLHWLDLPDIRCLAKLAESFTRDDTEIHDVISADGTVINDDIYKIRPLRFPGEVPHAHKATAFHYSQVSQVLHKPFYRIENTFLTSNLGLSCFELAVLGAGGSTSMGVDMSSSRDSSKKEKCRFQNLRECFDSDQPSLTEHSTQPHKTSLLH
jgi:hypothetical protein